MFDILAVLSLLNTFKGHDHVRAAQEAFSCMDYYIDLVLKAGQSRTDKVESIPLVWDSRASFGLIPFGMIFLTTLNVTLTSVTFQS